MLSLLTVTERLFSTILQGYISNLNAVIERSKKCGIIGDVSTYFITCYYRRCRRQMIGIQVSKHNSAQSGKATRLDSRKPVVCSAPSHCELY
jgi:hypothetical protein